MGYHQTLAFVTDLISDDPKIAQEINRLDKCLIDPPRDGASQL